MKFGLFLLYFVIMGFLTLTLVFLLNDGSLFEKDSDGYLRFRIKGGIDAAGWIRILCFSIGTGLMASIAPKSAVGGLICFIVMMSAMGYVTYWAIDDASSVKEVIAFIAMLVVCCVVSKMGAIAMGSIIRHYGWLSLLITLPVVALTACIASVIALTLKYHAHDNPRCLKADICKILSVLAVIVAVVGLVVAIYLFITGVQWRAF